MATEATPLAGDGLAAEVGELPDIARRAPGGGWVPAAALLLLVALPALISPYAPMPRKAAWPRLTSPAAPTRSSRLSAKIA